VFLVVGRSGGSLSVKELGGFFSDPKFRIPLVDRGRQGLKKTLLCGDVPIYHISGCYNSEAY
jgi:hypothetical protein